jgi:putative Mg2+ transporter-C (MgtC) family protein
MVEWFQTLESMQWQLAGQIALAAFLGGLIGLERDWTGHPAGLRTNMVVAIGSCLFTILSISGFPLRGSAQDTARIAAQIVSGIGFLGAGVLVQSRGSVHGLTTAATIWLVSAVGMAIGAGAYFLAVYTTLLTLGVLIVLSPISRWLDERTKLQRRQRKAERDKS